MSEMAPRKMSGSLIERAADVYGFGFDAPKRPAPVAPVAALPLNLTPAAIETAPETTPEIKVEEEAPRIERRSGARIDHALLAKRGLLVPGAPVSALAEEFRLIKRQLLATARDVAKADPQGARTALICSAKPNDGKTWCSLNLAISMAAERDIEVLLVDADFAKPDVMAQLGLAEGRGFLDALADSTVDIESLVVATDIPQLSLLPAGTKSHNDTELLASKRTGDVIARLLAANPRRLVIFDSPPVLAASPAAVLANHAGQIILVVRADRTSESDLREAVALLDACDEIQLVLNAVTYAPGGRRFGYYGQEYPK